MDKRKKPGIDWLSAAARATKAQKAGRNVEARRFTNHARRAMLGNNVGGKND